MSEVVELTKELIKRKSITPKDEGCQELIAARLKKAGFSIKHFRNHSDLCLAGEDLNFIKNFNSSKGKSIFKPVEANKIFSIKIAFVAKLK